MAGLRNGPSTLMGCQSTHPDGAGKAAWGPRRKLDACSPVGYCGHNGRGRVEASQRHMQRPRPRRRCPQPTQRPRSACQKERRASGAGRPCERTRPDRERGQGGGTPGAARRPPVWQVYEIAGRRFCIPAIRFLHAMHDLEEAGSAPVLSRDGKTVSVSFPGQLGEALAEWLDAREALKAEAMTREEYDRWTNGYRFGGSS